MEEGVVAAHRLRNARKGEGDDASHQAEQPKTSVEAAASTASGIEAEQQSAA
jgi:hypothetical protein